VSSPSPVPDAGRVVALAGGVGAARLLRGLVRVIDPADLTIIVNTGDDLAFYGVPVSPDVDIVLYTLAGVVCEASGFGIEGDSFAVVDRLTELGVETWFRLGDRDFAQCLQRGLSLRAGRSLCEITDELARGFGLRCRVLPMSNDLCPTIVDLDDDRSLHFEEFLVREGSPDRVKAIDLSAARGAKPAPGVLEAIAEADTLLVCPSNPVVSIGPILALPGVREALMQAQAPVVGISPIVGGAPIKGPADRLLRGVGCEVSAAGVAGLYRDFLTGWVIDERDAEAAAGIREAGIETVVTDTLMKRPEIAASLSRVALALAARLRTASA